MDDRADAGSLHSKLSTGRLARLYADSDPHLMVNTVEGLMAAGSVEAFPALVLPFVVEYDPDDNGKYGKHQGEEDNKEESQATQGRWWYCH